MKKLLFITFSLLLLSCTSNIDKKINLKQYGKVIKEIKASNTRYTAKDYETAAKELDKYGFSAMSTGKFDIDITYKELLNKAQQINKKRQEVLNKYNAELEKIRSIITVSLTDGKFTDISSYSPAYPNGYKYTVNVKNKSNRAVTAIKGQIVLTNENFDKLISITFKETANFEPNIVLEATDNTIILEDDNLLELKSLPFSKIKQTWIPELIIFKNGDRLEVKKPASLY